MCGLSRNAELTALLELRRSVELKFLGCTFNRGLVGSVTMTLGRQALGAWWHENGCYHFAITAYHKRSEYVSHTVSEVVATTREIAAKHAMYLSYEEHGIAIRNAGREAPEDLNVWHV